MLPPNFQIRPFFSDFVPKGPQKRPHISARRRNIQKGQRVISVLRLDWKIMERKYTSSRKPRCPTPETQHHLQFGKNSRVFVLFVWGTVDIGRRCIFFLPECSPDAKIQKYVGCFQDSKWRPEYCGPLYPHLESRLLELGFWEALPQNKPPQKN